MSEKPRLIVSVTEARETGLWGVHWLVSTREERARGAAAFALAVTICHHVYTLRIRFSGRTAWEI